LTRIPTGFSHARFIGSGVRLRRVIDEVVREELFENIEVPPVLDLLGTPADDGFRRIS